MEIPAVIKGIPGLFSGGASWTYAKLIQPTQHFVASGSTFAANQVWTNVNATGGILGQVGAGLALGGIITGLAYFGSSCWHVKCKTEAYHIALRILGTAALVSATALTVGAIGLATGGVGIVAAAAGTAVGLGSFYCDLGGKYNLFAFKAFKWVTL